MADRSTTTQKVVMVLTVLALAVNIGALVSVVRLAHRADARAEAARGGLIARTPAVAVTGPPLRIMTLGDSISLGWTASDHEGYRTPLGKMITAGGRSVQWLNRGIAGASSAKILSVVDGWLAEDHPDVVLLYIGTNDGGPDAPLACAGARIAAIVAKALAAGVRVVVVALLSYSRLYASPANEAAVNAQIWDATSDLRASVSQMQGMPNTPRYMPDGIHPGDLGFRFMAWHWYLQLYSSVLDLPLSPAADGPWNDHPDPAPIAPSPTTYAKQTCR